jgi:uncharacterized membrane protein
MPAKSAATKKTTTGLHPNTAAALSYVLGWLTGLVFLLIEKDKYVRFHAFQSLLLFGGSTVLKILLNATRFLSPVVSLIWIAEFILWLVLIYKAFQGEKFRVPYVGDIADQQVAKMK